MTAKTEVWARNPTNFIRECVEADQTLAIYDYGILKKRSIDVKRFMSLHFGVTPWRAMLVGEQGALEIGPNNSEQDPVAVYPVWEYGQSIKLLEEMLENPAGEDVKACSSRSLAVDERPVLGQEHRIVVIRPPKADTPIGKAFYMVLSQFQEDYPEAIIHVHGLYSYRIMFGFNFRSVDTDPRTPASKGTVVLPSGKEVQQAGATLEPHWVNLIGMQPVDLKIPRNRCIFNILSSQWAAEHFKEAVKIKTKGFEAIDPDNPTKRVPVSRSIMTRRVHAQEGDKLLCNTCSLQTACKYYREGAVCIVPGSEPAPLAKFFKSRDSEQIMEGLGTLLATQAARLDKALEAEETTDELLPETNKIIKMMFDSGVKLAKLRDPKLASAGAAKITLNTLNQTAITAGTPQALMASIVDEFIKRGIPRDQITPEMVMSVFEAPDDLRQKAIDVAGTRIS